MKTTYLFPFVFLAFLWLLQPRQTITVNPNRSAVPAVVLQDVRPTNNNGDIVYLTCAPDSKDGALSGLLSAWFKIKNNEGKSVTLEKIEYRFDNKGTSKVFSFSPTKENTKQVIGAGQTFSFQNSRAYNEIGKVIPVSFPFPTSMEIRLHFEGYDTPVTFTKPLKAHASTNSYAFPGKESDLGVNEYWYGDAGHGGGSQVFAYDIVMIGWDAETEKWSTKYPGKSGDKNEHFRCFGRPVYAVADGEVVRFNDQLKDNEPGVDTDGGGNTFHIKCGNEIVRYYHLKQYSLNKKFMKIGAKVKKGDWLARVGSTATASTHLHIDCFSASDAEPTVVFPLLFSSGWLIAPSKMKTPDPGAAWVKMNKTGLPFIGDANAIIYPGDKPSWYPGGKSEIARHAIAEKNYQAEFNKIWNSGYYPVWVDAYDVAGKTYFNIIFRPNNDRYEVAVKHDMNKEKFQDEYDDWVKKKGYRLQQVDNYADGGQLKFAAIFIKKPGGAPAQPAYHGLSQEAHQAQFDDLSAKGFVPINVSVTSINDKKYYAAFYEKKNTTAILKSSLTQQEYQDMFEDLSKKGWEQVYINAYHHDGKTLFSVIWYKNSGLRDGVNLRKASSELYQDKYEEYTGDGRLTRCVTGYEEAGKTWFAASWSK